MAMTSLVSPRFNLRAVIEVSRNADQYGYSPLHSVRHRAYNPCMAGICLRIGKSAERVQ